MTLTVEDLRKELRRFAEEEFRHELRALRDDVLEELQANALAVSRAMIDTLPERPVTQTRKSIRKSTKTSLPEAYDVVRSEMPRERFVATAPKLIRKSTKVSFPESSDAARSETLLQRVHAASPPRSYHGMDSASSPQSYQLAPTISTEPSRILSKSRFESDSEENEDFSAPGVSPIKKVIKSHTFQYAVTLALVLNMITFGAQVDWTARHWTENDPSIFMVLECIFCVIFVFEMVMRICGSGVDFCCGADWLWNIYDFILVGTQVTELVMIALCEPARHSHSAVTSMRTLRLLRLTRVARLGRMLRFFPELRMLMIAIVNSWKTLIWVVAVVLMTNFAVGVLLTQTVTQHKQQVGKDELQEPEVLDEFFGSLGATMLALYQIITEGLHWREFMVPLDKNLSPWVMFLFAIYVAFMILGMLNVVTSYFVETTISVAREDYKVSMATGLWDVFQDYTTSGQQITKEDFQAELDNKKMLKYLTALELKPDQIRDSHFFELIDQDHSGALDVDELIDGCLLLTGPAKALDLAELRFDFKDFEIRQLTEINEMKSALHELLYMLNMQSVPNCGIGVAL